MSEYDHKLVAMVNQIAKGLRAKGGEAAAETAAHIRAFWPPPMRLRIVDLAAGSAAPALDPVATEAIARLCG